MNKALKMSGACCSTGSAPKNAGTQMQAKGSAASIKNAVAMQPKPKGYGKIKGAVSG